MTDTGQSWTVWTCRKREAPRHGNGEPALEETLDHLAKRGDLTARVLVGFGGSSTEIDLRDRTTFRGRIVIAGIDLDSNGIHIVRLALEDDTATYNRIRVNNVKGDYHARARRLRDLMPARGAWKDHGVIRIAIELPMTAPGHGGFQSAVPQAVLRGALLACLPTDIPIDILTAHEWKKHSLGGGLPGKGNAKKPEIRAWAERHWPNPPAHVTQDAYDAFCIAWSARALLDHPTEGARAA